MSKDAMLPRNMYRTSRALLLAIFYIFSKSPWVSMAARKHARMMLGEHWNDPKTFFEGQQGVPKININI
jgi:hypothetical protein